MSLVVVLFSKEKLIVILSMECTLNVIIVLQIPLYVAVNQTIIFHTGPISIK